MFCQVVRLIGNVRRWSRAGVSQNSFENLHESLCCSKHNRIVFAGFCLVAHFFVRRKMWEMTSIFFESLPVRLFSVKVGVKNRRSESVRMLCLKESDLNWKRIPLVRPFVCWIAFSFRPMDGSWSSRVPNRNPTKYVMVFACLFRHDQQQLRSRPCQRQNTK